MVRAHIVSIKMACVWCIALVFAHSLHADWIPSTVGSYTYNSATNWTGGVINDQFSGALAGNQQIGFSADTSLNNFTYAATSVAASTPVVHFQPAVVTRTLTLNGVTRFVPWVHVSGAFNGPRVYFDSGLNLVLASSSPTIVAGWSGIGFSYLELDGIVSGSNGLTTSGAGLIVLTGNNALSGPLNIDLGDVRLSGANGSLQNVNTINLAAGGQLELGNNIVNNNRLSDTATINLNGGLNSYWGFESNDNAFLGNFLLNGMKGTTDVSEAIGTINLQSGLARVAARVYGVGTSYGNTTLTVGSLTRTVGSAVIFSGGTLAGGSPSLLGGALNGGVGAQSYIKFTTAPTLTNGILPYGIVGSDFANTLTGVADYGYEFATYDATNGIVPFSRTGTYVTTIGSATASDNVRLTAGGEALTANATMNSLTLSLSSGAKFAWTGAYKITLTSGALLVSVSGANGKWQTGAIDFNGQEAFVSNFGQSKLDLQGSLTGIGANGINFSAGPLNSGGGSDTIGSVALSGVSTNSITVPTRVLMGSLDLASNDPLGVSAVTVNQGATLSVPTNATRTLGSLSGAGEVRLSQNTSGAAGSTLTVGGDNTSTTFSGSIHAGQWVLGRLDNGLFANPGVTGGNLVKTGTGSLTLSGQSTYSGTTTISQGTLIAGADVASTTVYGGGLNQLSALMTIASNSLTNNSNGVTVSNGDMVVVQSTVNSGFFATSGTLYYVVNANGATFQIADTLGGAAKTITGGSIYWGKVDSSKLATGTGGDTLTLPAGMSLANGNIVEFSSLPTSSALLAGTPYYVVDVSGGNFKVSTSLGGSPVVNMPSGSFGLVRSGAFGSSASAIVMGDASTGGNTVNLLTGGAFTIERDITVANQGIGTTIGGNTADTSNYTGTITLAKSVNVTATTGGTVNFNTTGSGKITGGFGLTKTGGGIVVLGGANDYTGTTTVSAGTLLISGSMASSSHITLISRATLQNASGAAMASSLTLNEGSSLVTSTAGSEFTGAVSFSGNLSDGWTAITLTNTAGTGLLKGGAFTLTLTGITEGTYNLTTGAGFSGTFASMNVNGNALSSSDGGANWTGNNFGGFNYAYTNDTNQLIIAATPEPTTWTLLVFSLTAIAVIRRRRIHRQELVAGYKRL